MTIIGIGGTLINLCVIYISARELADPECTYRTAFRVTTAMGVCGVICGVLGVVGSLNGA